MKLNLTLFDEVEYAEYTPHSSDNWQLVEEDDWVQEGKYQVCTRIVKNLATEKYYRYSLQRSGSPFSDWDYTHKNLGYVELTEVVSKEIVETIWVAAK